MAEEVLVACGVASARQAVVTMATTMTQAARSTPVQTLDDVRTKPVRAALKSPSASIATCVVIKSALQRHYGSLKCAAITLDYDQSQLTRDLDRGDFKIQRLDADPEARAFVANALHEAFGSSDPIAIARRMLREARARIDEAMEQIA